MLEIPHVGHVRQREREKKPEEKQIGRHREYGCWMTGCEMICVDDQFEWLYSIGKLNDNNEFVLDNRWPKVDLLDQEL
jgi:hypothetical protein